MAAGAIVVYVFALCVGGGWGRGGTLHRLLHRLSSSACVYKDGA